MLEDVIEPVPEGKIYTLNAISAGTFFGSLIAGAFMMAHNYRIFGNKKAATRTWVISTVSFLALIATAFLPESERIPSFVYSAFCAMGITFFCRKYQLSQIKMHLDKGGEQYSGGAVVAVVLVCAVCIVALLLLPYLSEII